MISLVKCKRVVLVGLLFCMLVQNVQCVSASNKLHAYVLQKTKVYKKDGKQVGYLNKGIVFCYSKQKGNWVFFNRYGSKCKVKASDLVLNSRLSGYVQKHPSQFCIKVMLSHADTVYKVGSGKALYRASAGTEFKVFGTKGKYFKVQVDGVFGYLDCRHASPSIYVDVTDFSKIVGKTKAEKIVNFAKKFVGNPYVWGGTSLTSGCDCSGFTQAVYKRFGVNLPRCSYQQANVGKKVKFSELRPGDLIFYMRGSRIGHVTLYIGNGKVVQARGKAYGIMITRYDYNNPAWARRIL